ncbi:MAG: DUF4157 domain-containing protein [Anaerolineales bacterium]|nr:DUF4157 domain-containing protein [Anaerolineales bacterium]
MRDYLNQTTRPVQPISHSSGLSQRAGVDLNSLDTIPSIVRNVLRAPGRPLEEKTRAALEPHFGHEFGQVQIHTDAAAADAARTVHALAFTVGKDIVFGRDQYAPTTRAGRGLLAHELAHVVQQGAKPPAFGAALTLGGCSEPAEAAAVRAAEAVLGGMPVPALGTSVPTLQRQTTPMATLEDFDRSAPPIPADVPLPSEELLGALRDHDYQRFFRRLDSLSLAERFLVEEEPDTMHAIQNIMPPRVFWRVQLTLRFGTSLPSHVVRLRSLIYGRHAREIINLLRAYPALTNESQVPGVAFLLASIYEGTPEYEEIVDVATQPVWSERRRISSAEEAHYERDPGTGHYSITRYTNQLRYTLARTAQELRVIVRIRFVEPANPEEPCDSPSDRSAYVPESRLADWRTGIDSIWNNRFVAANGASRLRIIFQPFFDNNDPNPNIVITYVNSPDYQRSYETCWWSGANGRTIAHEFGHMLGNPDEYNLPGRISEISAPVCYPSGRGCIVLSPQDELRNTVEGLTGEERPAQVGGHDLPTIMGSGRTVAPRHVLPILEWYNANMLPADEAPYALERV